MAPSRADSDAPIAGLFRRHPNHSGADAALGAVDEAQQTSVGNGRPYSHIASRLHHDTISTLSQKRGGTAAAADHGAAGLGRPAANSSGVGSGNLLTIPALPAQPAMAPLSTYVVMPQTSTVTTAPRTTVTSEASKQQQPSLKSALPSMTPGAAADAARAAYGAANAAMGALGLASQITATAQRASLGSGQVAYVDGWPEPVGLPGSGAAGGEVFLASVRGGGVAGGCQRGPLDGSCDGGPPSGGGNALGPSQEGGIRTVKFDLVRPAEATAAGTQGSGASSAVTYVKLPEPKRFSISQMR